MMWKTKEWHGYSVVGFHVKPGTHFFEALLSPLRAYLCDDDNTKSRSKMDIARLLVRMEHSMVLNKDIEAKINELSLNIKLVDDSQGHLRIPILDFLN